MKKSLSCTSFKIKDDRATNFVKKWFFSTLVLSVLLANSVHAAGVRSSDLAPSSDTKPLLTLGITGQEVSISMAEIESLPMFDTAEMVHFDGPEGRFSGVWLEDLLIRYGLNESPSLRFIAIDGYEVFIPKASLERKRYLMATRLNGLSVSIDNLGPLLLIIPSDAGLASHLAESKNYWVWALNEIVAQ